MSKGPNMLSTIPPWDAVAGGYAETTMKVFERYNEKALELAELTDKCRILDVACGPGTLALAAADKVHSVHAIDFSRSMIAIFRETVKDKGLGNIEIRCGDAQDLPFDDESFDVAFSMFGLMFFPDRTKGYSEIYRTLKPGGKVIISSWAPISQSPAMQTMFGAVRAIKPEMPEPQTDVESLENPEFFGKELESAGFKDVEIHPVTMDFPVNSIDEFWRDMVRGSAPLVMLKNSMSEEDWQEKEREALEYLDKTLTNIPASLTSDAWLGCGRK
ncbi:MAG: class I SAM-dependent methyltransferase [Deltaproteobacteria bacterium]|nr:class I SAM-dependent methyltransferase [Deltaproteobacteria bacterium]